jgi:hypothetical protein
MYYFETALNARAIAGGTDGFSLAGWQDEERTGVAAFTGRTEARRFVTCAGLASLVGAFAAALGEWPQAAVLLLDAGIESVREFGREGELFDQTLNVGQVYVLAVRGRETGDDFQLDQLFERDGRSTGSVSQWQDGETEATRPRLTVLLLG